MTMLAERTTSTQWSLNGGVYCKPRFDCEGCGAVGTILHSGLRDHEFGAPGVWSTRRCTNPRCGLAWLDPQPRPDEIGRFYQTYWTHTDDEDGPGAGGEHVATGVRKLAKTVLANTLFWRRTAFRTDNRYLGSGEPGRLIDVGCGTGSFLAWMKRLGWETHGVDFDEAAVETARRQSGLDVKHGDLISQAYPEGYFDAVVMSNVVEHVPNPTEVFEECHRILAKDGRLVMVTPNIESIGHQTFGPDWRGLEPPRHLFLFTGRALREFARQAGFRKVEVFSSPGSKASAAYVHRESMKSAQRSGRQVPRTSLQAEMLKARALDLVGVLRGEWVILIATR